jgi:hypothetical protein
MEASLSHTTAICGSQSTIKGMGRHIPRGRQASGCHPRNEIDTTRQAYLVLLHTLLHPSTLQSESPACPMSDRASPRLGTGALIVLG